MSIEITQDMVEAAAAELKGTDLLYSKRMALARAVLEAALNPEPAARNRQAQAYWERVVLRRYLDLGGQ